MIIVFQTYYGRCSLCTESYIILARSYVKRIVFRNGPPRDVSLTVSGTVFRIYDHFFQQRKISCDEAYEKSDFLSF